MEEVYQELISKIDKTQVLMNEPMKNHTTFRVGGPADFFVKVKNIEELKDLLIIAKRNNLPITVIGNGSNVLVKDNGIRGICIKLSFNDIIYESEKTINVGAGVLLPKLARVVAKNGLQGLEFACGIPATVGGAVYMNAGAYNSQISDVILKTTYIDENFEIKSLDKTEQCFGYRKSIFQEKKWIIVSTVIQLDYGNKDNIENIMSEYLQQRKQKQPLTMPSAGSVFKRGNDFIAAELIDKCGLRGYKLGDAEVSLVHAGFIVNNGEATANDILGLVAYVKESVLKKFNKEIELEIKILGE